MVLCGCQCVTTAKTQTYTASSDCQCGLSLQRYRHEQHHLTVNVDCPYKDTDMNSIIWLSMWIVPTKTQTWTVSSDCQCGLSLQRYRHTQHHLTVNVDCPYKDTDMNSIIWLSMWIVPTKTQTWTVSSDCQCGLSLQRYRHEQYHLTVNVDCPYKDTDIHSIIWLSMWIVPTKTQTWTVSSDCQCGLSLQRHRHTQHHLTVNVDRPSPNKDKDINNIIWLSMWIVPTTTQTRKASSDCQCGSSQQR